MSNSFAIHPIALLNALLVAQKDEYSYLLSEISSEINDINFKEPNDTICHDLIYKQLVITSVKNFIYEQSEENKKQIKDVANLLNTLLIV